MNNVSLRATIIMGVNPGFSGRNLIKEPLKLASIVWQEVAEEEFRKTGVYISVVVDFTKVIYRRSNNCPYGGEDVVRFTSTANKKFIDDLELWKENVITVADRVRQELGQETVTVEFEKVEFYYIKNE